MDEKEQLKASIAKLINNIYDSNNEDVIQLFNESVIDFILAIETKLVDYNLRTQKCK